jgi:hypothetical protein
MPPGTKWYNGEIMPPGAKWDNEKMLQLGAKWDNEKNYAAKVNKGTMKKCCRQGHNS